MNYPDYYNHLQQKNHLKNVILAAICAAVMMTLILLLVCKAGAQKIPCPAWKERIDKI